MVPIELDDDADGPPPPRRIGLRTRRWLPVAALVAGVALVLGQWTADRLQRTALDALADRTAVVPRLGDSLSVRWSVPPAELMSIGQGAPWRGTVVAPAALPDGSVAVVAIDGRDGHRRWTTAVFGPDAQRAALGDALLPSGSCQRVPDDAGRVLCLVSNSVVLTDRSTVTTQTAGSQAHLVVVDPRTGRLLADHRLDAGRSTLDAVLPGGVAVMTSSRSSSARPDVVGIDPVSGAERWRTAPPALAEWGGFAVAAVGDAVAVIGGTSLDVLGPDGAVRRSVPVTGYHGYTSLPDGRIAVPETEGTLVVGPEKDVRLPGTAMWTAADDGSVPGLTLVRDGTLHAYGADGRSLWELPGPTPAGGLVLRGAVYVTRDGGVAAVDGSTGRVRWQTALPVRQLAPLTDGRVLLVTLSTEAAALDLGTGAVLWCSPLPPGRTVLIAGAGLVLAVSQDGADSLVLG